VITDPKLLIREYTLDRCATFIKTKAICSNLSKINFNNERRENYFKAAFDLGSNIKGRPSTLNSWSKILLLFEIK